MNAEIPYERLSPDVILDAVESCGCECTGSILGLASYENRVYQIATGDGFVVAKFYRPGRWSTDAILEEHEFALELAAEEIPVVPPIVYDDRTLLELRVKQARHPRAHSRLPLARTVHQVSNIVVDELTVHSNLVLIEYRQEKQRVWGALVRHRLRREGDSYRIAHKRVDLVNSEAELDGIAILF